MCVIRSLFGIFSKTVTVASNIVKQNIMIYLYVLVLFIVLNIVFDINYFVRTLFTMLSGRLWESKYTLKEITTIYDICVYDNCDVTFSSIRMAKLLRNLDFARFHFYDRTDIFKRSLKYKIKSLQGCTLTVTDEPVPLFEPYKIDTKLVHWDDRTLFFEHEVITLRDGKVRSLIVSRQHGIGAYPAPIQVLLDGLPGSEDMPPCPEYIKLWLNSMEISSKTLRNIHQSE